jgi:predicted nucleic acid-binding protein
VLGRAARTCLRGKPWVHVYKIRQAAEQSGFFGDVFTAAQARQDGFILLTGDQEFQPVKRLKVENWL